MKFLRNREDHLLLEFMNVAKNILATNRIKVDDERFIQLKGIVGKNMAYIGLFTHYLFNNKEDMVDLKTIMDLIRKYSQLLKNVGIDPLESVAPEDYDYDNQFGEEVKKNLEYLKGRKITPKVIYKYYFSEQLEDAIQDAIITNENLKFVKKFISNKYKHLINDETIQLFSKLKEIGEKKKWKNPHRRIQDLITSKLAIFKSTDDINDALKGVINQMMGDWNTETMAQKAEEAGADIIHIDSRFVVVDIKEEKYILDQLGSQKWCIVYSKSHFDNYVSFPSKQYIVYDTDLERTDNNSMIGVTINWSQDKKGKFRTAHGRADNYVKEQHFIDLGVRDYMTAMTRDNMISKIPELTPQDLIKYGFKDEIMKLIQDDKIDISNVKSQKSFLLLAARYGDMELLKYLDEKGADIRFNQDEPLQYGAQYGHMDVVKYLMDKGADPNCYMGYAISGAAELGQLDVLKYLIENGGNPIVDDNFAIKTSSENGHLDMVKYLMTIPEVDPSHDNSEALVEALDNKHVEIAKELLKDKRVDENVPNDIVLYASKSGSTELVKYFVEKGFDADVKGSKSLLNAFENDNIEMFEYLLSHKADPSASGGDVIRKIINKKVGQGNYSYLFDNDKQQWLKLITDKGISLQKYT